MGNFQEIALENVLVIIELHFKDRYLASVAFGDDVDAAATPEESGHILLDREGSDIAELFTAWGHHRVDEARRSQAGDLSVFKKFIHDGIGQGGHEGSFDFLPWSSSGSFGHSAYLALDYGPSVAQMRLNVSWEKPRAPGAMLSAA
jgi:hypothetical protein